MRMNGTQHVFEAMPFRLGQNIIMPTGRTAKLRYFDGERVSLLYQDDKTAAVFSRGAFMKMLGKMEAANE